MKKCRHANTWLVASGNIEWCYQCGAIRKTQAVSRGIVAAAGWWVRPTGENGENPWNEKWDKKPVRKKGAKE